MNTSMTNEKIYEIHRGMLYQYGIHMYFLVTNLFKNPVDVNNNEDIPRQFDYAVGFFLYDWSKEEAEEKIKDMHIVHDIVETKLEGVTYYTSGQLMQLTYDQLYGCHAVKAINGNGINLFIEDILDFSFGSTRYLGANNDADAINQENFWRMVRGANRRTKKYWREVENCQFFVDMYDSNYPLLLQLYNFTPNAAADRYIVCKRFLEGKE